MEIIDYGVCRLALVAVKKEPSDLTEQVTQLLFGDHYEVLNRSKDEKWVYIKIVADQCEGWIDIKQHHAIAKEYFDQINLLDFKITTEVTSWILYKKNPLSIVMGSIVPISSSELFKMEEQFAFNGESKSAGQRRDFEFIRSIALRYLHAPFLWGGKSPFGIDAPALVQMIYKIAGYALPRHAIQQAQHGKSVDSLVEAKPGDVAFFQDNDQRIFHTGIIIDEERILHADGRVRIDHLMDEGIQHTDSKIITHSLACIRHLLP